MFPLLTVNKMHSRRGHTTTTLFCTSLRSPTHPPLYVCLCLCSVSSPFLFSHFIPFLCFSFVLSFSLSFSLPLSSWPLRLTTTCITLHYNSSTICRAERKTTHTRCPLSPFFSLSFLSKLNHKTSGPKTVNCLETQYGLHPGDYTVSSASLH